MYLLHNCFLHRPYEPGKKVIIRNGENAEVNFQLQENAEQLDEVIVTSRKSLNEKPVSVGKAPINPMDLPQSIAVIGQGVIRDQGFTLK